MKKTFVPLYVSAILLTFMLTSCEKVVEFEGEITEPYMVMVSKPNTENPWKVRLTESRFFLYDDTIATIKNANVSIEVNGRTPNNVVTNHGNGMYDLGYTPQPGDSLTLHVSVPEKGTMEAGCRIPQRPVISNISCTYDTTHYIDYYPDTTEYVTGSITVKFTLDDPADEANFYMLRLLTPVRHYVPSSNSYDTVYDYQYITVDDNVLFDMDAVGDLFDIGSSDNRGTRVLFADERINGQAHTITFTYDAFSLMNYGCYIELYSISRDLYLFEKTLEAAENLDEFSGLISEPVQIHSNVTGGLGILGGSSVTKQRIY